MKRTITLAGSAVAGIAALALAVPQLAGAEESTGPESSEGADPVPGADEAEGRPDPGEIRDEIASRLADELGLGTAEVAAALETVHDELRAELGAEGAGRPGGRGGHHHLPGPFGGPPPGGLTGEDEEPGAGAAS